MRTFEIILTVPIDDAGLRQDDDVDQPSEIANELGEVLCSAARSTLPTAYEGHIRSQHIHWRTTEVFP